MYNPSKYADKDKGIISGQLRFRLSTFKVGHRDYIYIYEFYFGDHYISII